MMAGVETGNDVAIVERKDGPAKQRVQKNGWTAARRKTFLDVLASSSNVKLASEAVGIKPHTAYCLRNRDRVFADLWQEALSIGYDRLEHALLERARLGVNDIEVEGEIPLLVGSLSTADRSSGARIAGGRVEMDVKLAQWLIERHDKTVRTGAGTTSTRRVSREAVEAKIVAKLEALKKQGRFER